MAWEEAELDAGALAGALEREAPFLAPVGQLRVLGLGFWSRVLETESGWIVRLAWAEEAAARHAYETRVLCHPRNCLDNQSERPWGTGRRTVNGRGRSNSFAAPAPGCRVSERSARPRR